MTVSCSVGFSSRKARTASSSWARLGSERPSVAMLEPSTTTCLMSMGSVVGSLLGGRWWHRTRHAHQHGATRQPCGRSGQGRCRRSTSARSTRTICRQVPTGSAYAAPWREHEHARPGRDGGATHDDGQRGPTAAGAREHRAAPAAHPQRLRERRRRRVGPGGAQHRPAPHVPRGRARSTSRCTSPSRVDAASSRASRAPIPTAPTLLLMGHTDVVPANPDRWQHDPFGGELVDGEVWGRGAVDMLNLTASMAVATKDLVATGFRPKGTLDLPRRRRRGGARQLRRRAPRRARARRGAGRLRHHRVRRHPDPGAVGPVPAGDRRREGRVLVHAARARARRATARSPTAPTTRW